MEWTKIQDGYPAKGDFVCRIKLKNKKICLIRLEERYYATQVRCPHAGADLSYGWCHEGKLICPYHRHEFDLESGLGTKAQGDCIDVYPVEVRSDGLYIGLKKNRNLFRRLFG